MFAIFGLGNPGKKYEKSRHNVGRMFVDSFAKQNDFSDWEKSKNAEALYSKGDVGDEFVELILPETFMNKSGISVKYVVTKHDVEPEKIVVVYDDIDLSIGEIKISFGKGAGGHNGIDSIIKSIKTKDFIRIRVGVAGKSFWTGKVRRPPSGAPMTKYILGNLKKQEEDVLKKTSKIVNEAIQTIITKGIDVAMNKFN